MSFIDLIATMLELEHMDPGTAAHYALFLGVLEWDGALLVAGRS